MAFIAPAVNSIAATIYNSRNYMAFIAHQTRVNYEYNIYNSRNYMAFIAERIDYGAE